VTPDHDMAEHAFPLLIRTIHARRLRSTSRHNSRAVVSTTGRPSAKEKNLSTPIAIPGRLCEVARVTTSKPPIRLGFFTRLLDLADAAERYRLAIAQIVHAESCGFDSAWVA